jgi:non-specific serine/threonine protein kinase
MLREWRLEDVLGVGGFGIVYKARGAYFNELVAIKEYFPSAISDRIDDETVKPTDSSAEEIYSLGLQKFVEEAKILWQLSHPERHPNIVNVRSLFEIHGTAYMVMDFESGVSLSQMLKDGRRFDETSLMALLRPIAEGLERAHSAGVIHRDIKPPNLLVNESGRPVLIDFGSARFDSGQATSTKVTFYTPPYAALEQYVKTYPQGPWTDIYALGVVAYQCITGEKPADVLERMHGAAGDPLSARDWPGYGRAFTRAVDAAMRIRPNERPQSITAWLKLFEADAADVDDDDVTRFVTRASAPPPAQPVVEAAAPTSPVVAEQPSPPSSGLNPKVMIGAGVAALAVVGAVVALNLRPKAPPPAASAAPAPAPVASAPAAGASTMAQALQAGAAGLLADARSGNRPAGEISALSAAVDRITALATGPVAPVEAEARKMAGAEATALDRAAQRQVREIDRVLGKPDGAQSADAAQALADAHKAKSKLDGLALETTKATDATAALTAARGALVAEADFAKTYTAAKSQFLPARRAEFVAQAAQIQAISTKIADYAKQAKPGLFASGARKQAYQTLKTNDGRADAQRTRLEQLTKTVTDATDEAAVEQAMQEAAGIEQALNAIYESSAAAAQAAK